MVYTVVNAERNSADLSIESSEIRRCINGNGNMMIMT